MQLFDQSLTRREIERRVGSISQLGGTRHYQLLSGQSQGVRAVDCNTGNRLNFTVLPDRGMDISLASYKGINLVHLTANGEVNSTYYNSGESEWLKNFFGGLLTTCGLTYFGPPGIDGDENLGLHGRITNIPAKQFNDLSDWHGDDYTMILQGTMEECSLFGDKLRMKRTIVSQMGTRKLKIIDQVTNFGFKDSPFCILYHINPGFPLLDKDTELVINSSNITPYDAHSAENIDNAKTFTAPVKDFEEENFLHEMIPDSKGYSSATFINPTLENGLALDIRFKTDTLPYLSEWKMMGEGDYVVGLEPCNTRLENRCELRSSQQLPMLAPGEEKTMELELSILKGQDELAGLR